MNARSERITEVTHNNRTILTKSVWKRLAAITLLIAVSFCVVRVFSSDMSLIPDSVRSGNQDEFADWIAAYGHWAPIVSIALMVLQGILAPIPGTMIMIVNGLAFGPWWGGVITFVGQVLAASVCFALARRFGQHFAHKLLGPGRFETADEKVLRWGTPGLILARLIPGISFDAVSYLAGVSTLTYRRFVTLTAIGAAPQAFLYSLLIDQYPLAAWALAGVTIAIIITGASITWYRRRSEINRRTIRKLIPGTEFAPEHA